MQNDKNVKFEKWQKWQKRKNLIEKSIKTAKKSVNLLKNEQYRV